MTRPTLPAELPRTLPDGHRRVLVSLVERLSADPRIVGVAVAGSFVFDVMDEFSDLDLVVAVEPAQLEDVLGERQRMAGSLGSLLAAFTGEHVGEPRLLICLYGDPLLHVDLKFVALPDAARREIEEPVILWERDGRLAAALASRPPVPPRADGERVRMENRFSIWVHYTAAKITQGELFETIDSLAYLRRHVLGPLGLERRGLRPTGVRRDRDGRPRARAPAPCHPRRARRGRVPARSARLHRPLSLAARGSARGRARHRRGTRRPRIPGRRTGPGHGVAWPADKAPGCC